jgi:hypothetical protein
MDDAVRFLATDCRISQMPYCFDNSLNAAREHFLGRKWHLATPSPNYLDGSIAK